MARRCEADPLFASAAALYGSRAIGVVMSGAQDDGAAGAMAIKADLFRVALPYWARPTQPALRPALYSPPQPTGQDLH